MTTSRVPDQPSGHTDPEIDAAWQRAAKELSRRLAPYVQDHVRWPLALAFIKAMASEGFRPPLRPPRPVDRRPVEDQQEINRRGLQQLREQLNGDDHEQSGASR
ncbi:hypothetical protein [Spongiactinospora sp. TRM90649]|uniref:hypothetical protein n=1 Tax=Spongiactinospora sp. TRM90649 TaxID=3031114 RepID=UPI0023F7AFE7|nr:hypothetical protein [Spongiactinospora sp. TRM90649]MDF5758584.1 hypothetical protein [Spongiactinospora sp. TRM90649]